jgi:DNA-binding ferritin-like protein
MQKIPRPGNTALDAQVSELINELMNARTSLHKLHLKIKGQGSFAGHLALNEAYDALPGHADQITEQFQGAAERLLTIPDSKPVTLNSKEEGLAMLRDLTECVNKTQAMMPYSEIVNDMDLIKGTINSAKYKLLFLW